MVFKAIARCCIDPRAALHISHGSRQSCRGKLPQDDLPQGA